MRISFACIIRKLFRCFCFLSILSILFSGCATLKIDRHIVAVVDGEPITRKDLEYAIEIAHRREDLSETKRLNIREFINRLIEDRLIIQEARRIGMEEDKEIIEKVRAFKLRESVTMLYKEEVLNKLSVTDKEIKAFYRENYVKFNIGIIGTRSEEDAMIAMKELNSGAQFSEVAQRYSIHFTRSMGGRWIFRKKDIPYFLKDVILSLKVGETSDIFKYGDRYYIVRLIKREEPSEEDFEKVKNEVMQSIKSRKIEERSKKYLEELRTKYRPWIDKELLSSIPLRMNSDEKEIYLDDQRIIVRVNKYKLTVGEFVKMMRPTMDENAKQRIIDNWIDYRVVDLEALGRKYDETTDLGERIKRYRDQLLKKAFYDRIIRPEVRISPQELRDYYETHKDEFLRPTSYKIQKIVVDSEPLAKKILSGLKNGADFAYLARKYSKHASSSRGGIIGWKPLSQMSAPVRAEIKRLSIGDFSSVIKDGSRYIIIKVLDVTEKRYKKFDEVREIIQKRLFREKFRERHNSFVKKLKTKAIITINEDEVKEIEELFSRVK